MEAKQAFQALTEGRGGYLHQTGTAAAAFRQPPLYHCNNLGDRAREP